jgi:hypothetical protein
MISQKKPLVSMDSSRSWCEKIKIMISQSSKGSQWVIQTTGIRVPESVFRSED